jgi:hypothetical protein
MLGHSSITLTVDFYGKWLPMANKAAVDRLDDSSPEQDGSRCGSKRPREGTCSGSTVGLFARLRPARAPSTAEELRRFGR